MMGRPLTLIGALLAVLALVGFVVFGTRFTPQATTHTAVELKTIVVAAHDLSLRVPMATADLKLASIDAATVPAGSYTRIEDLKGLIPVVQILKGQTITANLVATSTDQISGYDAAFLPIPKGYVAMTLPTSDQAGVAGYIAPGDYISIQAVIKIKGKDTQNLRTIYTNVHVIRIGTAATDVQAQTNAKPGLPSPPAGPKPTNSLLTVIVTACQAEYLNWFVANEQLRYVLESYKDYTPQDLTPDANCPGVDAAGGVSEGAVVARWPALIAP